MVAQTETVMVMLMRPKKVTSQLMIVRTRLALPLRTSMVVLILMEMGIQMKETRSLKMILNGRIVMVTDTVIIKQVKIQMIALHAGVIPL